MPLTRDFKDTVKARAECDPEFRIGLLQEAVEAFIHGETEVGKTLLRDYVNATVGFGPCSWRYAAKEFDANAQ